MPKPIEEILRIYAEGDPFTPQGSPDLGLPAALAIHRLAGPDIGVSWAQFKGAARTTMSSTSGNRILRSNWAGNLGERVNYPGWIEFFSQEVKQSLWYVAAHDWIPRLIPGLPGGYAGLLHTAAAMRLLTREESDQGKAMLVSGLALWASTYLKLPGLVAGAWAGEFTPIEALAHIQWRFKKEPPEFTGLKEGFQTLIGFPSFPGVSNLVRLPVPPEQLGIDIADAFVRLYLSHREHPLRIRPFLAAVPLSRALVEIAQHIEPAHIVPLVRHGWQFAAAIYAIWGRANPLMEADEGVADRIALIQRMVEHHDPLTVLFAATAIDEFDRGQQPAFLIAAADALDRFDSPPAADDEPDYDYGSGTLASEVLET